MLPISVWCLPPLAFRWKRRSEAFVSNGIQCEIPATERASAKMVAPINAALERSGRLNGPAPLRDRRLLSVKVHPRAHQFSRRKIVEIFGWAKTMSSFLKSRYRGVESTHAAAP